MGVVSLFVALCYAELASNLPISGSTYSYVFVVYGEYAAWFVGWNLILEYSVAAAVVARSWSSYLALFLANIGLPLPTFLTHIPLGGTWDTFETSGELFAINILACIVLLLLTALIAFGIKESANFNAVAVFLKVSILVFFITVGFTRVSSKNFEPFFPFGAVGMFKGASLAFFAYVGFDGVSSLAEVISIYS